MKPLRVLALCAGYGGLELALGSVEDIELVAYAEYDDAPARIMAHHNPDVPNLRDVTTIDWFALAGIDVMTAGYPCQPFSHAGKRQGEDDPRHLWPHIAKGIAILRPRLCFFENVRGHLSLGFDVVLADLDRLGYDVRYYLLRAADVGAAHGRARLMILAEDRAQRGPVAPPTGTPIAYTYAGKWWEQADLFGPAPFDGKLPVCGYLHEGVLYAEFAWRSRNDLARLLPTPTARDWKDNRIRLEPHRPNDVDTLSRALTVLLPTPRTSDTNGAGAHGDGGPDLRTVIDSLLDDEWQWGDYGPAIRRWEKVTGRDAPRPTELNANGAHRLSPRFVEWLMGLPTGHVTDVPDITRNQAIKALGNGVVWQQAAAAYRAFLADTEKEAVAS